MKFTYEVGMRITQKPGYYSQTKLSGIVTEVEDQNEIKVQWDGKVDSHWTETYDLMPDTPEAYAQLIELTKQVQAKVDEATSALELAFKAWRQANAMQQGVENVRFERAYALKENTSLDLSKFEELVEDNGWSVSSLYC